MEMNLIPDSAGNCPEMAERARMGVEHTPERIEEVLADARESYAFYQRVEHQANHAAVVMAHMNAIIEQQHADLSTLKETCGENASLYKDWKKEIARVEKLRVENIQQRERITALGAENADLRDRYSGLLTRYNADMNMHQMQVCAVCARRVSP